MTHALDLPAWSALSSRHSHLAEGGPLARRYDPTIVPFAAARDDDAQSIEALGALAAPGEGLVLLQAPAIVVPAGCEPTFTADGVQMFLATSPEPVQDGRIAPLGEADAADMLELATLTKPGPFSLKAQWLGEFHGIHEDGRLIAMAGERMKCDGLTEVSGVCVHPDHRGRGLARLLSIHMTHQVLARDETPFLHAFASNAPALRLYESIGYVLRSRMHVAFIQRAGKA